MPPHHEQRPTYENDEAAEAEFWTKRDDRENLATKPPPGERVNRPVVVVAECYVGGDVARLVDGVTRLGASREELHTGRPDFSEWANRVRSGSRAGGSTHIGGFRQDDGTAQHFMGPKPLKLPDDFARLVLHAYAPTPAVVVLVATFALEEAAAQALDDELRTNRYLRRDVTGSVTTFVSASHRKREEIDTERERIRKVAANWIADRMPGTLTTDFLCDELPSVEVLTTQLVAPFEEVKRERDTPLDTHRSLLRINNDWDAWESPDLPHWRFGLPGAFSTSSPWAIVAGCIETPLPVDENGREDRRSSSLRPHPTAHWELAETFGEFLVRWTLRCLLVEYEARLAQVRDDLASERPKARLLGRRPKSRPTTIKNAQKVLSALAFDAAVVTHELAEFATDKRAWEWEVPHFTTCAEFRDDDYPSLLQLMADDVADRCKWASNMESRLREQITLMSNLEVSATNLRLQGQVFWLTIATVAIAIVGVIVSARSGG